MQNRFKFRAWDKKRKRMYEVLSLKTGSIGTPDCAFDVWAHVKGFCPIEQKDIMIDIQPQNIELMQCTGLKDKNQNPIYEGDIVELDNIKARGAIEWDNFYCEWRLDPKIFASRALQGLSYPCQLTIIGNIHENKELLEVKNGDR